MKGIEKNIVNDLFAWEWVWKYDVFWKRIADIIRSTEQLSFEQKQALIDILRMTINDIQSMYGDHPSHEQMISYTNTYYDTHHKNWSVWENENVRIVEYAIPESVWDTIAIQPMEGVYFKWWVARNIARKVLDIPSNSHDACIDDIDAMIIDSLDLQKVAKQYKSDPVGFSSIRTFDNNFMQYFFSRAVDCTINQILVSHQHMYITPECIESLRTGKSHIVANGESLYGSRSWDIDGERVHSSSQLIRAIYFLITWKIISLEITQHNILPANLEAIDYENAMLVLLRKLIAKEYATPKKAMLFWRLEDLLHRIGIIPDTQSIFTYYDNLLIKNPWFNLMPTPQTMQKYGNWILSKLIKIKKNEIVWITPVNIIKDYDTTQKQKILLTCNLSTYVSDHFYNTYMEFEKNIVKR